MPQSLASAGLTCNCSSAVDTAMHKQVADPFSTLVKHWVDKGFGREEVALALAAQKGRLEGNDAQVQACCI